MARARTRERPPGIKWGAVALGWVVAVVAGIVINFVLRIIFGLFVEFPPSPTELTVGVIVVSLLSGFLAYLIGGYAAGRSPPGLWRSEWGDDGGLRLDPRHNPGHHLRPLRPCAGGYG
jgi:hypothetical protein